MRHKFSHCRSSIPEYIVNEDRYVDAPNDNKKEIDTANALIDHYQAMSHDDYVRPIQILVCGRNPRAVTAVVDEIIGSRSARRGNYSNDDYYASRFYGWRFSDTCGTDNYAAKKR